MGTSRRAGLGSLLLMLLACARTLAGEPGCAAGASPFTPWRTLTHGLVQDDPLAATRTRRQSLRLVAPVAVAARGNDVYVLDAMQNVVLRFDLGLGTLARIAAWRGSALGAELLAARDLTFTLLDPRSGTITQYTREGALLRQLDPSAWPGRPTTLVPDEAQGGYLVADGLAPQIVAFDGLGAVRGTLGGDAAAPLPVQRIDALAAGRDRLYVVDRSSHEVIVLARDGAVLGRFGGADLKMPTAIAVDGYERVLVADGFDNRVKLFVGGTLTAAAERGAGAPGRFREVRDLWVDGALVYVCDTLGARVEILHLDPPCR
ncbi:MAG: hypothetical protein HY749_07725 [Gammaproteobacteria bacterium]|nr:hypothetical protein [Gammaproteobacteria bacterium]